MFTSTLRNWLLCHWQFLFFVRLELFQSITQDYCQRFGVCDANRCDKGFFLHRQVCAFSTDCCRGYFWGHNYQLRKIKTIFIASISLDVRFLLLPILWRKVFFELEHCMLSRLVSMLKGRRQKKNQFSSCYCQCCEWNFDTFFGNCSKIHEDCMWRAQCT